MESVRFIDLEVHTAFENMAIDEAIMISMKEGTVAPTLRFYRWLPSAVSIGTFQGMTDEVDLDYCEKHNIDAIRRITGGGAVYHDYNGEITYSLILPRGHRLAPENILESYGIICGGLISALKQFDIDADFRPVNDVIVGDKKISGNAQTRRHQCVLQHGTTLLDLDVGVMFSILKVPQEKISDKMIQDVKQRVTSIRDILNRDVAIEELQNALKIGFSEALDIELIESSLTHEEQESANELINDKYVTKSWNMSR